MSFGQNAPVSSAGGVTVQRVRLRLSRLGPAARLTHLQQIEAIRRALMASGWPLATSGGKRPRPRIAFGPAISVGVESLAEYCDIELASRLDIASAPGILAAHLPEGYAVISIKSIPRFFPSLEESTNVSGYVLESRRLSGTDARWETFRQAERFLVTKKKADREEIIDARALVMSWTLEGPRLTMLLRFGPGRTLKPERIAQAVCGWAEEEAIPGDPMQGVAVRRTQLCLEKKDGTLVEP